MTKQEYLIKLLTALETKWSMASGLKVLVEHNVLNDQTIDALQHIFAEAIKDIHNEKVQIALSKSHVFLKNLQAQESLEYQKEDDNLAQLLADI